MTKQKTLWGLAALLVVSLMTGCKNNNLFGDLHKEGSGDASSLVADGQAALGSSDFEKANSYFSQALEKDPRNSDALYGQSAAQMGLSGLSLGQLISNLTQGNSNLGAPGLHGAIRQASLGAGNDGGGDDPNSLLFGINEAALDDALKIVIRNMEKIRMGFSDGKIPSDNASLLINLGLARLLKGATGPLRRGVVDLQESGGNYSAQVTQSALPGECAVVENAVYNVAWGYKNLSEAATKLNLVSGSTLADITADVDALFADYRVKVDPPCGGVPDSRLDAGVPASPDDRLNP